MPINKLPPKAQRYMDQQQKINDHAIQEAKAQAKAQSEAKEADGKQRRQRRRTHTQSQAEAQAESQSQAEAQAEAQAESQSQAEDCIKELDKFENQQDYREELNKADNHIKKELIKCNKEHPGGPKFDEVDPSTVQSKQPRNWLDILLKIGLGVCILVLLLMVYKLISGDSDSLLGNSNEETPMKKDDLTLFPGLFDEPLTLFERGDSSESDKNKEELKNINKSITEINDEITKIRLDLPCDKKNQELYKLTQKYSEQYKTKEERDELSFGEVLSIDGEIQPIWINGSDSGCKIDDSKKFYIKNTELPYKCPVFEDGENDTNSCKKSYLFNYLDNGVIQCPTPNDEDVCDITGKPWKLPDSVSNIQSKYNVCISENDELKELEKQLKTYTDRRDEILKSQGNSKSTYKILFG